jgi:hypothetical protein
MPSPEAPGVGPDARCERIDSNLGDEMASERQREIRRRRKRKSERKKARLRDAIARGKKGAARTGRQA